MLCLFLYQGTDSIDLSMHDNLGHYLTSGRSNKLMNMGGANSNYYMGGSNAQLILTDTTNCGDSNYGVSQHHQLVYDMRKSKQGGAPGTMRTATYCSPNGTLSRFNVLTNNNNNGFENDAETERNGSGSQSAAGAASCATNTLGKQQQLNPRNLNGILNGFFQHQAQPNDYSSSGHIGQILNQQNGQFNTVKSNKGNGNHYLLPSSNQAFDQTDQAENANEESHALNSTEIAAPQTASAAPTPAQFYYGQQNYASFNANNQALLRQTATNQSVRGPHALSNIYSDDATAQPANNLPSVIYERDSANNYSNRKIYTTSSFGRQPETPQAQPKNVIPPTLKLQQQQQQQQQQSLISSTDSNNFYGRRGASAENPTNNNTNYASNRDMTMTRQLNMNTYYERNQVYQIHQQQQQPTYHTHMEAIQQFQPPALPTQPAPELPARQVTPPPPPPPPEQAASNVRAPPVVPVMPPQVPQLPKNLPPSRPIAQMTHLIQTPPPPPPVPTNRPPTYQQTSNSECSDASSPVNPSSNISISLKSGDRVIMNNTAGSRKPLSGFQSFV